MSANPSDSSSPLAEITHGPSKFEQFLENNQKLLMAVAILLALGTAAFVVIQGVEKSKQETAGASLLDATSPDELKSVIEDHAGTKAATSAKLLLADAQWQEGDRESAIATLESFVAGEPDHPAAATAKASLASKWVVMEKSSEAALMFQDLVDDPKSRHLAPFALISLGDIAAADGDSDKAKASYDRVLAEFSDSDFAGTANSRLNDLGAVPPTEVAAPEPVKPSDPNISDIPDSIRAPETPIEPDTTETDSKESDDKSEESADVSDKDQVESKPDDEPEPAEDGKSE